METAPNAPLAVETAPRRRRRGIAPFYWFIAPWLIIFVLLGIAPLLWGLYLSFTDFSGFNLGNLAYLGLENYIQVFTAGSGAISSLLQTLKITALFVPISIVVGLGLAVLVNRPSRLSGLFRILFYLPSVLPPVIAGLIWRTIYAQQGGLIGLVLGRLGLPPVNFLGYSLALFSLMIMLAWGSGIALMIYLSALRTIPRPYYEAAQVDGASPIQQFFRITLPLLTPQIFFNLVINLIAGIQIMAQPLLLTPSQNGLITQPIAPLTTIVINAWLQMFANAQFGYGMALIWVLFLVLLVLTLLVFWSSRYWVRYYGG